MYDLFCRTSSYSLAPLPGRFHLQMVSSSAEILTIMEGSDSGYALSKDKKVLIDAWLTQRIHETRPYDVSDLFGNFMVSYVLAGYSQKGNPAGGNYHGPIGRIFLRTTGLYQHLLHGGETKNSRIEVINLVVCKLLSILEVNVVLRGFAKHLSSKERDEMQL